jgi:hypothetical protein
MPRGVDIYPPEADFECVETKIAPHFVFAIIHSKLQNARTFIRKKHRIWRFYTISPPTQGFYEKNYRVLSARSEAKTSA